MLVFPGLWIRIHMDTHSCFFLDPDPGRIKDQFNRKDVIKSRIFSQKQLKLAVINLFLVWVGAGSGE